MTRGEGGIADNALRGTCHVVAGGVFRSERIELADGDLLIAADSGYLACELLGLAPDVLIGDFDSLGSSARSALVGETIELPCAKDDTDTLAALRVGLERGYYEFRIYAALGGDVGHELANIHCLCFLADHGAHGVLLGGGQRVELVCGPGGLDLHEPEGTRVSVFAFGGSAHGVVERGLRWCLEGADLHPGDTVGVSNCTVAPEVHVGLQSGCLLVVIGQENVK